MRTPRWPALALVLLVPACGTPGRNVPVEVPPAPAPDPEEAVAREAGRLLSADRDVSREAERRLLVLDDAGRRALAAAAARMGGERDPRWLHVLDEHGMLPPLAPAERLEFLLWKAARDEPVFAMKARSALTDLARSDPDLIVRRLAETTTRPPSARTARDVASLAVCLAVARVERAVPALIDAYVTARDAAERRAAAEALALLAGEERRPRVNGAPEEIRRDADALRRWWAEREGGGRG